MSAYELPEPFAAFQFNSGWRSWEQVVPGAIGEFGVVSAYTADQMQAAFEAGRLQGEASGQAVEREADAARIDWLESRFKHGPALEDINELEDLVIWHQTQGNRKHANLRDALDAARGVT